MKFSSSAILLAAAMGVSAHPSGHAHMHAQRRDFVVANKPVVVTKYATHVVAQAAPTGVDDVVDAIKTPFTKPEPTESARKPKHSKPSSSAGSAVYQDFCAGNKAKRATIEEIAYKGNTGSPDDFGCNMMVVDASVADDYQYIITFDNADSKDQECVCFNKIGPDGGINGFWSGNEAIKFTLPGKGSKVVAFDDNTQGGCACGSGSVPLTPIGQFASTWVEFDFGNESNDKWSGADASCLVAAAESLDIPGLKVCGHNTCSTIYPGGTGENAYLGGMEAEDGVGLNIPAGKARLEVTVAYSK
ncbi:hypothetical protein FZEAL_2240 [Fusarium zealandicum]|uniref:Allergen Asp f 4 n=1 Tax=Fusarium zealandicum TaxID=1053134 RepID=A0A8H4XNS7_9HYPO|nr:hypothetical protein FZEAL_2240 [Fusarium zealandicum]